MAGKQSKTKKKGVIFKDARYQEAARRAYQTCLKPSFLASFPPTCRDLVQAKLSFYHAQFGTKIFNQLDDVMLIHLLESSSIGSIPEICREQGKLIYCLHACLLVREVCCVVIALATFW